MMLSAKMLLKKRTKVKNSREEIPEQFYSNWWIPSNFFLKLKKKILQIFLSTKKKRSKANLKCTNSTQPPMWTVTVNTT